MSFAAYLHNQFARSIPLYGAAVMTFTRRSRFVEGYDPLEHLDEFILEHFPNVKTLHRDGLQVHYDALLSAAKEKKLIGLLLLGADRNTEDRNFYEYVTADGKKIELTRHSICYHACDRIDMNELDRMCRETPLFDAYYDHCVGAQGAPYVP